MTWIETIAPEDAEGRLKALYARVADATGQVDNILRAHSLRPHTLEGHMALYKSVLHHFGNRCDPALLETIGVAVSLWNGCRYCVAHHRTGLARLLGDKARATAIAEAIAAGRPEEVLDAKTLAALGYAEKLTRAPARLEAADIEALRAAGFSDGE
ncbi:MAG: carboxymuconolactone decarboxylase family protein, partial [Rhodothalassiaceae bacterium]